MTDDTATSNSGTRETTAGEIETAQVRVGELEAYLARPAGGSAGGMLLLPMVTGINAQVREFAHDIARSGVTALSWDPWHGPSADDTPSETLFDWLAQLDDETVLDEQRRLLDYMFGELGIRRAGLIGWCLGGRFALILAGRDQRVSNVVAYHPTVPATPAPNHSVSAVEHTGMINAPVMMLYPAEDHLVSRESFDALQQALQGRQHGASIVHLYPGAEHGFSIEHRRRDHESNAEAYAISWPQALAFITATTQPPAH